MKKKITNTHSQHFKCDKLQWKALEKKTRKARLDGWIASFDLLEFLVNSLTALSTQFGWRGEKHIAISINHMRIMQSVTNKGYESIGMLNF